MKLRGENLRVFLHGAAIPEEVNCSVTMTGNTEDVSTKDDGSTLYGNEDIVSTSFSAQLDNYQSGVAEIQNWIAMFNSAAPIPFAYDQTGGSQNRVGKNAAFKRSGKVLVNDINFVFNDRQTVSTAVQLQGTGALSS